MTMDLPTAKLKTATTPEAQKLYSDAVKNFKKVHGTKRIVMDKFRPLLGIILCIYLFYTFIWANSQLLPIYALICSISLLDALFDLKYWLYTRKIRKQFANQYLKTFGKITQVLNYDAHLKRLQIELEFYDLAKQMHQNTFTISYPEFSSSEYIKLEPERLLDQTIEVCLTPDFALLLQIRTYNPHPDKLPIFTHQLDQFPLWQRYKNFLLHPQYFYPESILSIRFIRHEYASDFQFFFQGLDQDFIVTSTSSSLEQIEDFIFASYSDFFMKHDGLQPAYSQYRQLKFSNEPVDIELWKNPTKALSDHDILNSVKQRKKHILLWMILSALIILLSSITVSIVLGFMLFIIFFVILSLCFTHTSNQYKKYQRYTSQL